MKKQVQSALLSLAVATMGLAACDRLSPPKGAPLQPGGSEAAAESETLVGVVRASLAETARDPDAYARARKLGNLLPTLGPEVVPAVTQTLKDPMLDLSGAEIELLVRYWATHQPEEASRWAATESPAIYRTTAVFSALSVWAEANPRVAVDRSWTWAGFPDLQLVVPVALVRGWYARNDPPELREFLRSLLPNVLGQRAIGAYVRVLMQTKGFGAVRRWAESLPADNESDKVYKLTVFRRVVDALSRIDVEEAKRWCDAHCDGPYGDTMLGLIASNWAIRDGAAALAWLQTRKPGYETNLAVQLTWGVWARKNRAAAMAWMAEQTAGDAPSWLQPVYPYYATLLAEESPLEGLEWSERIESDQERVVTQVDIVRHWRMTDEAAAERWLLQSSLSEEARSNARAPLPQRPRPPEL